MASNNRERKILRKKRKAEPFEVEKYEAFAVDNGNDIMHRCVCVCVCVFSIAQVRCH